MSIFHLPVQLSFSGSNLPGKFVFLQICPVLFFLPFSNRIFPSKGGVKCLRLAFNWNFIFYQINFSKSNHWLHQSEFFFSFSWSCSWGAFFKSAYSLVSCIIQVSVITKAGKPELVVSNLAVDQILYTFPHTFSAHPQLSETQKTGFYRQGLGVFHNWASSLINEFVLWPNWSDCFFLSIFQNWKKIFDFPENPKKKSKMHRSVKIWKNEDK